MSRREDFGSAFSLTTRKTSSASAVDACEEIDVKYHDLVDKHHYVSPDAWWFFESFI